MNGFRLVDAEGALILSLDDEARLERLLAVMPDAHELQTLEGVLVATKVDGVVVRVAAERPYVARVA